MLCHAVPSSVQHAGSALPLAIAIAWSEVAFTADVENSAPCKGWLVAALTKAQEFKIAQYSAL